jgi:hypothetical protein
MKNIEVYKDYGSVDGEPIAIILVDDDGKLTETIVTPGADALRLQDALAQVRAAGALLAKAEERKEIDGQEKFIMKQTRIEPGRPGYEWAVKDHLQKKSNFWCEICIVPTR